MRPEYDDMVDLLKTFVQDERTRNDVQQALTQLGFAPNQDVLTGFGNRLWLHTKLESIIDNASEQEMLALFVIDLDGFRLVNESLGHDAGDQLLRDSAQRIAEILEQCAEYDPIIARIDGDEFAVVLVGSLTRDIVLEVAENIHSRFQEAFQFNTNNLYTSCSIGIIVESLGSRIDAQELMRRANGALYLAKTHGKNSIRFYSDKKDQETRADTQLEFDLHQAISRNELELYYHPLVNAHTRMIGGVEALVRWNHPTMGLVSPGKFIPVAERSGLIIEIGKWILENACRQNRIWHDEGYRLFVAVNISTVQFMQADFIEMVANIIQSMELDPHWIDIEITESVMMSQIDVGLDKIRELFNIGVSVVIDDFGTGFSSLAYLQQLPVNTLKIDQSFVMGIGEDPTKTAKSKAIVKAITALAHQLGLSVVAEGVETRQQLAYLLSVETDMLQGYLFSEPKPTRQIEKLFGKILIDDA